MSFSFDVKAEILQQEFNVNQAKALINGIVSASGDIDEGKVTIKLNNQEVSLEVREILNLLKVANSTNQQNKNWIVIKKKDVEIDFKIKQPGYYFAGVFIGGGSISDPNTTSYHLEMQFYYRTEAIKVMDFLSKYEFKFTMLQRRKKWVIYLKKSEMISDFLKAIQATKSLIIFEDVRIRRDFYNHLNRYSNLDLHNQEKLSKASVYHLENYKFIVENKLQNRFNKQELSFFELKKKHPFSSLSELVILLEKKGIKKTRSGLNHWLIKLRKVVEEFS